MHKSQRFVHFYVELLAGFEPATSSLPRSGAETRQRKNRPHYTEKVFAIKHKIQYKIFYLGKNAEQQQTPLKRQFVCYRLLFFRFRAFQTVKNRLLQVRTGQFRPVFWLVLKQQQTTISTEYPKKSFSAEQKIY